MFDAFPSAHASPYDLKTEQIPLTLEKPDNRTCGPHVGNVGGSSSRGHCFCSCSCSFCWWPCNCCNCCNRSFYCWHSGIQEHDQVRWQHSWDQEVAARAGGFVPVLVVHDHSWMLDTGSWMLRTVHALDLCRCLFLVCHCSKTLHDACIPCRSLSQPSWPTAATQDPASH